MPAGRIVIFLAAQPGGPDASGVPRPGLQHRSVPLDVGCANCSTHKTQAPSRPGSHGERTYHQHPRSRVAPAPLALRASACGLALSWYRLRWLRHPDTPKHFPNAVTSPSTTPPCARWPWAVRKLHCTSLGTLFRPDVPAEPKR